MGRLLLVTLNYPPNLGGVARHYAGLVRALGAAEVAVLTDVPGGPAEVGVARQRFTWSLWPRWLPLLWRVPRAQRRAQATTLAAGELLPVGTALWLLTRFTGTPYVVFLHGLDVAWAQASLRKRWLARRVLARARAVVANSEFTKQLAVAAGSSASRTYVVQPAVELPGATVTAEELRARHGLRGKRVLLSVARLVPRKGIDDVVSILPELTRALPDVAYVVVGEGPERPRLERLAARLGVSVKFIGAAADTELAAWYELGDVFVLTPKDDSRDVEGFGLVYLEAMAARRPVVATPAGGVPEVVGEVGWLVKNSRELIAALAKLFTDPALRRALGERGAARAAQFTYARQAAMLRRYLYGH